MSDKNILFAILLEIRPVVRNPLIDINQSSINKNKNYKAGDCLCTREYIDERVFFPRLRSFFVFVTTPDIHHLFAIDVDSDRSAKFLARLKISLKKGANVLKLRTGVTVDSDHFSSAGVREKKKWTEALFQD
jgi:hypothetical protein